MQNNFEAIKQYILDRQNEIVHNPSDTSWDAERQFEKNEDKYYVVELMRRGKDNPDIPAANMHFKNYYINKVSDLDKYRDEIIFLCDNLKMRAYFSVNYKSYSQVLMDTVAECARRVAAHDYKKPYSIFESCSGKFCADGNKTWVVDVDQEDADNYEMTMKDLVAKYKETIESVCHPYKEIITTIHTKSGMHIICRPFNVQEFNNRLVSMNMLPHSDNAHQIIKKNHLTLLYCF